MCQGSQWLVVGFAWGEPKQVVWCQTPVPSRGRGLFLLSTHKLGTQKAWTGVSEQLTETHKHSPCFIPKRGTEEPATFKVAHS